MKSIKKISLVALLVSVGLAFTAFMNVKLSKKTNETNKGFAVIELFTSEGCSSCPPADELVAKIEKESKDKPVYVLAFHVDYWDRYGWKDAFSNAEFTARQGEYVTLMHLQSPYTPQIVVNGRKEFVGSEEGTLRSAIHEGLQQTPAVQITLNLNSIVKNKANIKYTIEGQESNNALLVAVVQKWAQIKVKSGENGGHTLSHIQIVRKLQKVNAEKGGGIVNIQLPEDFDSQKYEMIGFLQNKSRGTIISAARATFLTGANTPEPSTVKGSVK
jgi:hypothetical protein